MRVGLLLLLILLGHDMLMASAVHAAPSSATVAEHEHGAVGVHDTPTLAGPENEHHPGHPTQCGAAVSVAPTPAQQFTFSDFARPLGIGVSGPIADAHVVALRWQELFQPPGMTRALLQVYRI